MRNNTLQEHLWKTFLIQMTASFPQTEAEKTTIPYLLLYTAVYT